MDNTYKLTEFTVDEFRKYVSPKTRYWQAERKKERGKEVALARIIDYDFDRNILLIATEPTYNFNALAYNPGQNGGPGHVDNIYEIEIQFVDIDRWRDSPWSEIKLKEFKDILKVVDIKLNCSCFAFYWQSHRHELTTLDSAVYPYSGTDTGEWKARHSGKPGLCKHLSAILPILNFQAPAILKTIRDAAKRKGIDKKVVNEGSERYWKKVFTEDKPLTEMAAVEKLIDSFFAGFLIGDYGNDLKFTLSLYRNTLEIKKNYDPEFTFEAFVKDCILNISSDRKAYNNKIKGTPGESDFWDFVEEQSDKFSNKTVNPRNWGKWVHR